MSWLIRSLPPELTEYVERGFEVAGSLAKRKGEEDKGFLLVTRLGKQISRGWITKRVTACTKLLVGIALSPQKLRRATATSISSSMPEMAYLATLQLQHYDPRETEGYDKSSGLSAALAFDEMMEEKYSVELEDDGHNLTDDQSA